MLCPFCMLDYTMESPCFCHSGVRRGDEAKASAPMALDVVRPAGEFNFAVLTHFDLASAAPYLGA